MPVPNPHPNEDFCASALRHFTDATLLLGAGRYDNAVYLAGYVQEAALKASLAVREPGFRARTFSHDLARLSGAELAWRWAASEVPPTLLAIALKLGGPLGEGHPDRRYWPAIWTGPDAQDALEQCGESLDLLVFSPMLDRGAALPEHP